jgi:hypothetical protein
LASTSLFSFWYALIIIWCCLLICSTTPVGKNKDTQLI